MNGEKLILEPDSGTVHQLNATAGFVWELCDGRTPIAKIVSTFASRYRISQTVAERDVRAVVGQLSALRLLKE